jgi:hypothetical protein
MKHLSLVTRLSLVMAMVRIPFYWSVFTSRCQRFVELSVKEIRPPRMDDSGRTKYPVLFRV